MLPVLAVVGVPVNSPLHYSELYRSPGRQSIKLMRQAAGWTSPRAPFQGIPFHGCSRVLRGNERVSFHPGAGHAHGPSR
jgi:hypothetical protein